MQLAPIFLALFFYWNARWKPSTLNTISCDLSSYQPQPGLKASIKEDTLQIRWEGDDGKELELKMGIERGVPTIYKLSEREPGHHWTTIVEHIVPEFRVVSGVRRITQQQTEPLKQLGIPLTTALLDSLKWDAFWDAPLYISENPPLSHQNSIPAAKPFANHPGMPRQGEEVLRSAGKYHCTMCKVKTNGSRLEVIFPGISLGLFEGYLQFDVFKGSNLIRQMAVVRTKESSVAFKYDAGLKGFSITDSSFVTWRDLADHSQKYFFGGLVNDREVPIKSRARVIAAQWNGGALAAFPPPHSFFWARESEQNLGYSWYRKDSDHSFSFGIRQAELEEDPEYYHNFALYNARPGKWQRLPVFYYISSENGHDAIEQTLRFTHGDRFKSIPGYKVMGHHYHVGLVQRLKDQGGLHQRLNDVGTMKAAGIDIFSVIDGARGPGRHDRGDAYLTDLDNYYQAAHAQSDKGFLLMPSDENSTGGRKPILGGHYDILPSKPIYWRPDRKPGQPLFEDHQNFGRVYNLGTPSDLMVMTENENVLISMPHPRTKRSTGYPDAIKDSLYFLHENYFALGYRWGMGIDGSERRLGEYRFLKLWNEVNNWMAQKGRKPKFALAISEARSDKGHRGKPPYDDVYGMAPVNYVQIEKVPSVDDMSSIVNALKDGRYFVTSGEVLIPSYSVTHADSVWQIVAEVHWTFPLEFVEIVSGDGEKIFREIIPTTELQPFGTKTFTLPFDARGKKWVRFAAWDVATNGAMVQPVNLN